MTAIVNQFTSDIRNCGAGSGWPVGGQNASIATNGAARSARHAVELWKIERLCPFQPALGEHFQFWLGACGHPLRRQSTWFAVIHHPADLIATPSGAVRPAKPEQKHRQRQPW